MNKKNTSNKGPLANKVRITLDEIKQNYTDILKSGVPIERLNREGQLVIIPPKKLEQYIGDQALPKIVFYIEKNWRDRIKETLNLKIEEPAPDADTAPPAGDNVFSKQIKRFDNLSFDEREEVLDSDLERIHRTIELFQKFDVPTITNMVSVISNAWHVNKITLQENRETEVPRSVLERLIEKTNALVDSIVTLLSQESMTYRDLNLIENISTGSNTIDHMNKVLLRFIPVCIYYNEYFTRGRIGKIRAHFKDYYGKYYQRLLAADREISLEVVYKGGMRRITSEEMHIYSLGALLHDVGKLPDIEYHEDTQPADRKKIMRHAPYSYNMIIKAKLFPWSVAYMALLHHEYYGDPAGYNFARKLFAESWGGIEETHSFNYFISYDHEDMKNGVSLSYFPIKILEMIDVFDDLTIRERGSGHKSHSLRAALRIMKEEYIEKSLKLDPILFTIFEDFIEEYAPGE